MAAYATAYGVLKDSVFTVDTVDFANQVAKVKFTPDQQIQTFKTLDPDGVLQDVDSATWVLEMTGVQGKSGLAAALWTAAAAGDTVDVVYQPKTGTGQDTFSGTVQALYPSVGGDQGNFATFDISLPVVGTIAKGTSS